MARKWPVRLHDRPDACFWPKTIEKRVKMNLHDARTYPPESPGGSPKSAQKGSEAPPPSETPPSHHFHNISISGQPGRVRDSLLRYRECEILLRGKSDI